MECPQMMFQPIAKFLESAGDEENLNDEENLRK